MAPIHSLPVLKKVIQILSDNGIHDPEDQSLYMYGLADRYTKNHDLDALNMKISQLFNDMGLGAGEDEDSRNHHLTYAYFSGMCLFLGWGQQPSPGRSGTFCLYCSDYVYKMKMHLAEKHSATLIPTLIRTMIALADINTREQNTAETSSLPFSPTMNGQLPWYPDPTTMNELPGSESWPLFVTNALRGHSYEQHGETTTELYADGTLLDGRELEAQVDPMLDEMWYDHELAGPSWNLSLDQGDLGDNAGNFWM